MWIWFTLCGLTASSNSITNVPFVHHSDIVKISNLKQQNDTYLQYLATRLNNSFGIILQNVSRINKKKRTEYIIQHIANSSIKAGIKRKYLQRVPNIYIHGISNMSLSHSAQLLHDLIYSNPDNKVLYIPSHKAEHRLHSIRLLAIHKLFETDYSQKSLLRTVMNTFTHCLHFAKTVNVNNKHEFVNFLSILHTVCDPFTLNVTIANLLKITNNFKFHHKKYIRRLSNLIALNFKELQLLHPFLFSLNIDNEELMKEFEKRAKINAESILGKLLNMKDSKKGKEYFGFWSAFLKMLVFDIAGLFEAINKEQLSEVVRDIVDKSDFTIMEILWCYDRYMQIKGDFHIITHSMQGIHKLRNTLAVFLNRCWNIRQMSISQALASSIIKVQLTDEVDH